MSFENTILITIIDKCVIGLMILFTALYINKKLEKYKFLITRQGKIKDIKYEKVAKIIDDMWKCVSSINAMIGGYKRKEGVGNMASIKSIIENDSNYKQKAEEDYNNTILQYADMIVELQKRVNSSYFYLGKDLYVKATNISEIFNGFAFAILNSNMESDLLNDIQDIEVRIHSFEDDALKYIT